MWLAIEESKRLATSPAGLPGGSSVHASSNGIGVGGNGGGGSDEKDADDAQLRMALAASMGKPMPAQLYEDLLSLKTNLPLATNATIGKVMPTKLVECLSSRQKRALEDGIGSHAWCWFDAHLPCDLIARLSHAISLIVINMNLIATTEGLHQLQTKTHNCKKHCVFRA
jgi:hypothetical protein